MVLKLNSLDRLNSLAYIYGTEKPELRFVAYLYVCSTMCLILYK